MSDKEKILLENEFIRINKCDKDIVIGFNSDIQKLFSIIQFFYGPVGYMFVYDYKDIKDLKDTIPINMEEKAEKLAVEALSHLIPNFELSDYEYFTLIQGENEPLAMEIIKNVIGYCFLNNFGILYSIQINENKQIVIKTVGTNTRIYKLLNYTNSQFNQPTFVTKKSWEYYVDNLEKIKLIKNIIEKE